MAITPNHILHIAKTCYKLSPMTDTSEHNETQAKKAPSFADLPKQKRREKIQWVLNGIRNAENDETLRSFRREVHNTLIEPMSNEDRCDFFYDLVKLADSKGVDDFVTMTDAKDVNDLRYAAMPHIFFTSVSNIRRAIKERDIDMLLMINEYDITHEILERSLLALDLSSEDCTWFAENAETMINHMTGKNTPFALLKMAAKQNQNELFFALWDELGSDELMTRAVYDLFKLDNREILRPFIDQEIIPFVKRHPTTALGGVYLTKDMPQVPTNMAEAMSLHAYQNGYTQEALYLIKELYTPQNCPNLAALAFECTKGNDANGLQVIHDLGADFTSKQISFRSQLDYAFTVTKSASLSWLLSHAPEDFELHSLSDSEFYEALFAARNSNNRDLVKALLTSEHNALPLNNSYRALLYHKIPSTQMLELILELKTPPPPDASRRKSILLHNHNWTVKSRLQEAFAHEDIRALSAPLDETDLERLSDLPITRLRQPFNKKAGRKERATILAAVNDRVDLIMQAARRYEGPKPFSRIDLYDETSVDSKKVSLRGVLLARGTMGELFDARYWKNHQDDLAELWKYAVPDHHKPKYEKAYETCLAQIHMIENPRKKRLKII